MTGTPERPAPTTADTRREIDRAVLTAALCRVAKGDQVAFGVVYQATHAKLLHVCMTLLKSRQTAEDVLQITYVIIWQKSHMFDAQLGSPIGWMTAIARNRALDELRMIRRFRTTEPIDGKREFVDPAALASEIMERDEQALTLRRSLDQLPDRYRSAISAAFYEDLTYQEVADREHVPCSTMKSWIRRGIGKLKTSMVEPANSATCHVDILGPGHSDHDADCPVIQRQSRRPRQVRQAGYGCIAERLVSSATT